MRWFLLMILLYVSLNCQCQRSNDISHFDIEFNIGMSRIAPMDRSLLISNELSKVDNRIVGNAGLGVRWNILKKSKIVPCVELGINVLRSKATGLDTIYLTDAVGFKNTFGSYTIRALGSCNFHLMESKLNGDFYFGSFWNHTFLIFPYAVDYQGREFRGFQSVPDNWGSTRDRGPYYKGPKNIGFTIGAEMPYKKLRLGLFLDQRVYFEGFNREISRLSLRLVL